MYHIIGAAIEVHKQLGRGLSEAIYQEALEMELEDHGIIVEQEKKLQLWYKGRRMKKHYFADMFYNGLIIELKSVSDLSSEHRAQLLNYLRISKTNRGLLINFGERRLHIERYLYLSEKDGFILLNEDNYKQHIDK